MRPVPKKVACALIAALLASSPASAATTQFVAPLAQTQSPWVTLTMLTPVSGATLGQSAAAAAAAAAAQPEGPPPPSGLDAGIPPPPIPVIAIFLATLLVAVYAANKNNNHHAPNSPA